MNYANMIEEKRLKQGFILATLISTIAGTFTTGINLYDRVIEKRKQNRLDKGQDAKIRELEQRVNDAHSRQPRRQPGQGAIGCSDVRDSLERGGPTVQREYDQHYAQLGSRYAEGDTTAQLQLQSQLITLQGTVIEVLQEALYSGQPPDLQKLYNASEFARDSSVRALADQYRRMLQLAPSSSSSSSSRRPVGLLRRTSSTPSFRHGDHHSSASDRSHHHYKPPTKALTFGTPVPGALFCRSAAELQKTNVPLDAVLDSRGVCPEPGCSAVFGPRPRAWRVEKDTVAEKEYDREAGKLVEFVETRTFQIPGRFLAKCHRGPAGGYACYLCARHRERDTLCRDTETLVAHISDKHDVREFESDPDIREIRGSSR